MKLLLPKGSASVLVDVFIQDSGSSVGAGKTGLLYNSAGLTWYYHRDSASSATQVTLATMTVGTWASGGFKEVDATNMPGVYQLGIPDAALAEGAKNVSMLLKGASGMAPLPIEIQLIDVVYHADVWMADDNAAGTPTDHWFARWYRNGVPVTSGITSPTIQVVKPDDTDLIASSSMTAGSNGRLRYDATGSARLVSGVLYEVTVTATIDGATRTFYQQMSRDS